MEMSIGTSYASYDLKRKTSAQGMLDRKIQCESRVEARLHENMLFTLRPLRVFPFRPFLLNAPLNAKDAKGIAKDAGDNPYP